MTKRAAAGIVGALAVLALLAAAAVALTTDRSSSPQSDAETDGPFDLIFIDGGHTYEVASADIANMKLLAHDGTVLVFDDLLPHKPWGPEPVRAWGEAIADGVIVQTGLYADGVEVDEVGPEARRGWAVGRYA